MLPEIVLDCRDPSQWVVLDGERLIGDVPPAGPSSDSDAREPGGP